MNPQIRHAWIETDYPAVRRIMGAERERLDDEALEEVLGELFPEADPADVEDFMRSVQQFGKQAAPLAQKALPGMIQGAKTGAAVGGPWGAVAGALGGGALSVAGGGAPGPKTPSPPSAPVSPSATPDPGPAATNAAAAQLLALLSRPETMQALLALLMANAGRPAVRVGDQPVPAAAFANAIAELAAETAAAFDGPVSAQLSDYLNDAYGGPRIDVMNPAERAGLLLAELARVAEEEAADDDEYADEDDLHDD